ncbi:MAG: tRNA (N(6)-L-threonylcarbamoyladenosine(37)-C(2))-methylthiotransferase MtaB [Acidobacteriota bacterium]
MKKAAFYTLGCKLNYAETASLERKFADEGFEIVPFDRSMDVCVINTCTVTERADREARQIVRRALRTSPDAFVIVLGCYAQLDPEVIASIEGVDLVLGASEKFRVMEFAGTFEKFDAPRIHVSPIAEANDFGVAYSGSADDRTRAFLKVQDGCDFNCSYCTIPLARGKSRSQAIEDAVSQARALAEQGYKEVVLTGVNVGDYGTKSGSSLRALLKALETVEGIRRIRISSIEPNLLDDELLEYWASSQKICSHFHIPLQSGSDKILRLMRRRYTTRDYEALIRKIHARIPDAGIGVDVIVGFPGETREVFEETHAFLSALPVSYLHVFTYSERANTPSLALPDRIEPKVRAGYSRRLRMLGQEKKADFYRRHVGSHQEMLCETTVHDNMLSGYTDNYIRVHVPYHPSLENAIARVRLTHHAADACTGVVEALEEGAAPVSIHLPIMKEAS